MKRIVSVISTAEEANAAHRRIVATVQDAIAIGEFLTRQKAKLKHGEWLPWVKENLEFSRQTADNYRRLYENRDKLPSLSNLSLWNAYALTWNAYALTNGDKRSDSKVQPEKPGREPSPCAAFSGTATASDRYQDLARLGHGARKETSPTSTKKSDKSRGLRSDTLKSVRCGSNWRLV